MVAKRLSPIPDAFMYHRTTFFCFDADLFFGKFWLVSVTMTALKYNTYIKLYMLNQINNCRSEKFLLTCPKSWTSKNWKWSKCRGRVPSGTSSSAKIVSSMTTKSKNKTNNKNKNNKKHYFASFHLEYFINMYYQCWHGYNHHCCYG